MNKAPEHGLLPQWEPSSPKTGSMGLIDQLLETGALTRELIMPNGVYQVKTVVELDAQQAMLFRSSVLHDEHEITAEPWEPIFRNLTQEIAGQPARQARLHVARLALETHLRRCDAVARQLEEKGDLSPRGRIDPRTSLLLLAGLLLVVGTLSGVWLWQTPPDTTMDDSVPTEESASPTPPESPDGSDSVLEDQPEDPHLPEETSTVDTPPKVDSHASTENKPTAPDPRSSPSVQKPSTKTKRKNPPKPETSSKSAAAPPVEPREPRETSKATSTTTDGPSTTSLDAEKKLPQPADRFTSLVSSVVPRNRQDFEPEPGTSIYRDPNILLSEIPSSLHGKTCITTSNSSGDTEQGILVMLEKPATVLIAHDTRIKKKPDWIESFSPTGEVLKAEEVDRGRTIEFAIYRRTFPRGLVTLGSNTNANPLTRRARKELGFKKRIFMYLVCI